MDIPLLHMSVSELVQWLGYVGVFGIVFFESGVPISFIIPLPGDTLLFVAGILASKNMLSLPPLMIGIVLSSIIGNNVAYWIGHRFGRTLFSDTNKILNTKHLVQTEAFYAKYGMRAIVIGRFFPVLRALVPLFAGIAHMPYKGFLLYNVGGAIAWTLLLVLFGYFFGNALPNVDQYVLPVVLAIAVVPLIPPLLHHFWKKSKHSD